MHGTKRSVTAITEKQKIEHPFREKKWNGENPKIHDEYGPRRWLAARPVCAIESPLKNRGRLATARFSCPEQGWWTLAQGAWALSIGRRQAGGGAKADAFPVDGAAAHRESV
jgi:hypothetical protein